MAVAPGATPEGASTDPDALGMNAIGQLGMISSKRSHGMAVQVSV
jgi:hypothetical protein